MIGYVNRVADRCGDFMVSMAYEMDRIVDTSSYQIWLLMSSVVLVIGFLLLKGNR